MIMMAAEKFFPRRAARERCHPNVPSACCDGRRKAVAIGEYYFDHQRGGWVDLTNPVRSMTWEAVYKSGQNSNGEPYILDVCGYCGCELPMLFRPDADVLEECQ